MAASDNVVLHIAVLGVAVFGLVEAAKWTWLGTAGFGRIRKRLGRELFDALAVAYGPSCEKLLRGQYREHHDCGVALGRCLRAGIRLGLTEGNALALARALGVIEPYELAAVASLLSSGQELTLEERGVIDRFQVAVDARVQSALCEAQARYVGALRLCALLVAVALAQAMAPAVDLGRADALLIGMAAMPLAQIASDVAGMLQAATRALRLRVH